MKKIKQIILRFLISQLYRSEAQNSFKGVKVICFDLDGVIVFDEAKRFGESWTAYYIRKIPVVGARRVLNALKKDGWIIIIYTSRIECDKKITEEWLGKYEIPYDLIIYGKPVASYYIDDRAVEFRSWEELENRLK